MGSTQLTANGLNTIGTKVTLNRVMVHLGFQLHRSFCRLSFPLQASLLCKGKIVILPHYPPQALSLVSAYFLWPPLFQWGYCLHHSAWAAASLPPELAPPRSLQTGCTAVPKRVIPVSCSPCAPSLPHSTWGQLLQLQRFYRRVHRPHGRSWETCQIPHAPPPPPRQWHQSQDSLPAVIIFALYRDLSHAAATTCLQDTKAMKTRLMKSVCEPFSLA